MDINNNNNFQILNYELYKVHNNYFIDVPIHSLLNLKFYLKENNLFINDLDNTLYFRIENIPDYIKENILDKKCYLREIALSNNRTTHLIEI